MIISKSAVTAALRQRGQHVRADFVERELPEQIDVARHSGLFSMLRLDPAQLAQAGSA